jgi:hypothetical protein
MGPIRAVANLKLCVYYLKHMERDQRQTIINAINLVLVHSYRDQQRHEVGFNNTAEEPVKLLPLPQPSLRARTDARINSSAQRATQLRSVLARVYAVSRQNQITTTVP